MLGCNVTTDTYWGVGTPERECLGRVKRSFAAIDCFPVLASLVQRRVRILTEGSVYELLRRNPAIVFDDDIAHAGLIYDRGARELLAGVHRAYISIAEQSGLPMMLFADTWRASGERVARSRFRDRNVNRDNVEFLRALADASPAQLFIGALTGPRGDAYRPAEAPSEEEARRYHASQIGELAGSGVDLIAAVTLPALPEARGIAALLSETGVPWMLSFVVRPAGTLLDGTPLADAIASIDRAYSSPPIGFSVNCVHPGVLHEALSGLDEATQRRVISFQANASSLTPEELDGRAEIDSDEPGPFAHALDAVACLYDIPIVGGCCGTDPRHIAKLAALSIHPRA